MSALACKTSLKIPKSLNSASGVSFFKISVICSKFSVLGIFFLSRLAWSNLRKIFYDSYPDLWSEVSQRDALFPQSAGCFSSDFGSVGFRFLYWSAPPPPDIMLSSLQPLLEPGFFNHLNQPERGNDTPLKFIKHFFGSNIWIQE